MNLLLTGGTGFFGRSIIRHIAQLQPASRQTPYCELTVITRSPKTFTQKYPTLAAYPWLKLVEGDVTRADSLNDIGTGTHFSALLHAAADSTDATGLSSLQKLDQIVNGTRNMLEFSVRHKIPRFLLTSSGGVYGPQPHGLSEIPECYCGMPDPLLPASTYGVAKRQAEHLCSLYSQAFGLEVVIARCFAVVGEDLPLDAHFAVGNFIRDALWRDSITVSGDGTALRSYLDQSDLAHWLMALIERGKPGEAYNVGSDKAISIAELATLVRDTLSPHKAIRILGTPDAQRLRHMYIPNTKKVSVHLGLHASKSLKESIQASAQAALSRHYANGEI
jgi:UDP-glucuronate decarboxylase